MTMNLLTKYTAEAIIAEGKLDDLRAKYAGRGVDVDDAAANDPSGPNKLKYTQWMLKQLEAGASPADLYPTVAFFDKNAAKFSSTDVNSYKTLKALEDEAKEVAARQPSKQQQKLAAKSDAAKIYEGDDFVVVRPDTKRSCMVYGSGTKWCITMGDASYYEQYTSANVVFYFVLSKKRPSSDPLHKVAAAVMRDVGNNVKKIEWYDAKDTQISTAKLKNELQLHDDTIEAIKRDAASRPMGLLAKLKNNLATEDEIRRAVEEAQEDEVGTETLELVAQNEKTPGDVLRKLADDENDDVKYAVAKNLNTPSDVLRKLADDENDDVKYAVAKNLNTPSDVLRKLADDEDSYIRYGVAKNLNTPSDVLRKFADDKDSYIRYGIAQNPNTPPDALRKLADDKNKNTRVYVALNPNTPSDVLRKLADDKDGNVKLFVAENPNTPIDVLRKLADDKDNNVVQAAADALKRRKKTEAKTLLRSFINEAMRHQHSLMQHRR